MLSRCLVRGERQGKYLLNGDEQRASLEGQNHKKQNNQSTTAASIT